MADDTSGLNTSLMVEVKVDDCWPLGAGEAIREGQLLLRLPSMARLCLSLHACSQSLFEQTLCPAVHV